MCEVALYHGPIDKYLDVMLGVEPVACGSVLSIRNTINPESHMVLPTLILVQVQEWQGITPCPSPSYPHDKDQNGSRSSLAPLPCESTNGNYRNAAVKSLAPLLCESAND